MSSSGTLGIGQCTTVYLALRGATVYACAPDIPRERAGVEEALARIEKHVGNRPEAGMVYFHELDLSSVQKTVVSAKALKERIRSAGEGERLDILVGNAAVVTSSSELSPDGYEKTFAVNCLGHFVFVNNLLGAWSFFFFLLHLPQAALSNTNLCLEAELMKSSANQHGEARITITSSSGFKMVPVLDYEAFTTSVPRTGFVLSRMLISFRRYTNSKLGSLYLVMELDRRLREAGVENIRVNAVHPGTPSPRSLSLLSLSALCLVTDFSAYELKIIKC